MEKTLVLLKPSCVQRQLIGEILNRFERRGLRVAGMKMMQLSDEILREHYAHLVDKPFFPSLAASMQASPVVALALELKRFFKDEEIFDYQSGAFGYIYGSGEAK